MTKEYVKRSKADWQKVIEEQETSGKLQYAKTLVTDGFEAYARFTEKTFGLIHALC